MDTHPYYWKVWWTRRASQEPAIAPRIGSVLEKRPVEAAWIAIINYLSFPSASSSFPCIVTLSNSCAPSIHPLLLSIRTNDAVNNYARSLSQRDKNVARKLDLYRGATMTQPEDETFKRGEASRRG